MKTLLSAGASPNDPGSQGITPLMQAAEMENADLVRLLLDGDAQVNRRGDNGYTPLHLAVDAAIDGTSQQGGKPGQEPTAVIEMLLQSGADATLAADNGETPLDWARNYGSDKIEHLLRQPGEP